MEERIFKSDFRKENPGLHRLYFKWAITHLITVNKFIKALNDFSNCNTLEIASAVVKAKEKLIEEDAAYFEANEILLQIENFN